MTRHPDIGVFLKDSAPLIRLMKGLFVEEATLLNPQECLPRPNRVTVYLSNHGPITAPFPPPILTVEHLLKLGGYEELVAVTLFHWIVEITPGLSPLLKRYLGHSTRALRSMEGVTEMMRQRRFNIIGTAPEGSSSGYYYDEPVGPFTRCGLIVAGLLAGADFVLTAQKGIEHFGRRIPFPGGPKKLPVVGRPNGVQLINWYPGKRARVTLKYGRYVQRTSPEELAAAGKAERRSLLGAEIQAIHAQLSDQYRSIP